MSGSKGVGYTAVMGMSIRPVIGWYQDQAWYGCPADGAAATGAGFGSPVNGEEDFNPELKIIIKPHTGLFAYKCAIAIMITRLSVYPILLLLC